MPIYPLPGGIVHSPRGASYLLGELMGEASKLYGVADEGGFWPAFDSNEEALTVVMRAIERAGYRPLDDIGISLDVAASQFGRHGRYTRRRDDRRTHRASSGRRCSIHRSAASRGIRGSV